jgi:hypothetical protein
MPVVNKKKVKHVRPKLNDLCRVIQSGSGLGPTLYIVDYIDSVLPYRCVIREAGNPLAGGQEFDLSLLQKEMRDAGYVVKKESAQRWRIYHNGKRTTFSGGSHEEALGIVRHLEQDLTGE